MRGKQLNSHPLTLRSNSSYEGSDVCYRAQEEKSRKMAKPTSQNFFGSDQASQNGGGKGNLHAGLDPSSGSLVWD